MNLRLGPGSHVIVGIVLVILMILIGLLYPQMVDAQEGWKCNYYFQSGPTDTSGWNITSLSGAGDPKLRYIDTARIDSDGREWFEASFTVSTIDSHPRLRIGLAGMQSKQKGKNIDSEMGFVIGYLDNQDNFQADVELRTDIETLNLNLYIHRLALLENHKNLQFGPTLTARINQEPDYIAPGLLIGWGQEQYNLELEYYLSSQVDWRVGATYAF